MRVYALLCKLHHKVNIVSTCSQHHESLPPLPFPPPTYPTNPPHTQAPSPGSDRHGGGPDRWRLRRRARTGGGSVSGLLPTRRCRRLRRRAPPGPAALSPGSDRHGARPRALPTLHRCRLRRRAPPGPAALSPGSDRHGGGPDRWRLRRRALTGGGSVSGLIPGPPVPATLLHVRTAPTPVGKVTTLLHVRTAPTPVGKVTPRIPHTPGRKPGSVFSQPSLGHLSGCGRAARQQ